MTRRLRLVAWVSGLVLLVPGVAFAAWATTGAGSGRADADRLTTGATPTVSVTGRNVTVTWTGSTFANGSSVGTYRVARYPAAGGSAQTILSACSGTIGGTTCTENAVPPGSWRYAVMPVRSNWTGTEGTLSATATVGSPTFSFSSGATLLSLPGTTTGTLSNFITGETVQFRLDAANGPLLTGSTTPPSIPFSGAATTSTTVPAGTTDGTHTVYAVGSAGTTATATVQVDLQAPSVSSAAIGKTAGGKSGSIRQGGTYYVYANVSDAGGSVATVTANVSAITTGSSAVPLTAGSYTAGGVPYGYRSAALTASNPLAPGAKGFSVTATDANAHTATFSGFSVTVDNTAPAGSDVTTTNVAGGTAGKAEAGDSIAFTFSEPIDANSIVTGWGGTGSQTVTVRLIQNGAGDRVQIWDAANATQLPLGQVNLGGRGYTAATVSFSTSTMTMSGSTITVVLGAASGATSTGASSTMQWTPSGTATDWAGNACSTGGVTGSVTKPQF